jgi:pimeloyl-ACP methyl ester carboxylesterase
MTQIAYADSLVGEPVVMLHCSSASGRQWDALRTRLGAGFRTIVPDQWGCGDSPAWSGEVRFTLAHEAEPILDLIESVGEPVHLVGHSYGGGVALHIARRRPQRIKTLTLIEPSSFHVLRGGEPSLQRLFAEIAGVADDVRSAIACGDNWGGMARFVDYWNGDGAWETTPQKTRLKLCQRLSKVALDFHALFEEPVRLPDYAGLVMPTLLLCGERTRVPSRKIVDLLSATLPHVRVQHIEGAGHMSPFTHSDDVNRRILGHLCAFAARRLLAA